MTGLFVRRWLVTAFHFFIKSPEEGLLVPPKYCRQLIAKFTLLGLLVWKDTVFKKLKIVYPVLSRPYRGILTCPPPGGRGQEERSTHWHSHNPMQLTDQLLRSTTFEIACGLITILIKQEWSLIHTYNKRQSKSLCLVMCNMSAFYKQHY